MAEPIAGYDAVCCCKKPGFCCVVTLEHGRPPCVVLSMTLWLLDVTCVQQLSDTRGPLRLLSPMERHREGHVVPPSHGRGRKRTSRMWRWRRGSAEFELCPHGFLPRYSCCVGASDWWLHSIRGTWPPVTCKLSNRCQCQLRMGQSA